jgi:thioredoxin 1
MQTTFIITGVLITFLLSLYLIARYRMNNAPVVNDHVSILTLTEKNFQHQTKKKLVLVDFWANWCIPYIFQP